MKHESLVEISRRADVLPLETMKLTSRRERLQRWAAVLEQHEGRVKPFERMEYMSRRACRNLRDEETPVALAFADPVLRAAGLKSDRLGDAMTFFGLSYGQTHRLLCDCHYQGTMTGRSVAAHLRAVADGGIVRRIWDWGMARVAMAR